VLGLFTRASSLPLAGTMVVAILSALLPDVSSVLDLLALDETLYLFLFGWLIAHGPGWISLDHLLVRAFPHLRASGERPRRQGLPA
jgi:uncharacterized membrane protein YphA (DoxX/SURF4 family)